MRKRKKKIDTLKDGQIPEWYNANISEYFNLPTKDDFIESAKSIHFGNFKHDAVYCKHYTFKNKCQISTINMEPLNLDLDKLEKIKKLSKKLKETSGTQNKSIKTKIAKINIIINLLNIFGAS